MIYESRKAAPLSRAHFTHRLLRHFAAAAAILLFSLFLGIAGYMYFESLPWRDAFLNSAMLLGGMGPVDAPKTNCRGITRRVRRFPLANPKRIR